MGIGILNAGHIVIIIMLKPKNFKGSENRSSFFHQIGGLKVVSLICLRRKVIGFVPISVYKDSMATLLHWNPISSRSKIENLIYRVSSIPKSPFLF